MRTVTAPPRAVALLAALFGLAAPVARDVLAQQVPAEEWVRAFDAEGDDTPYPAWDLFIGACPADEQWRNAALQALLRADFDHSKSLILARMIVGGAERCGDDASIAWIIDEMRTLAYGADEGDLLGSYVLLTHHHRVLREHPALVEMMSDTVLDDSVRSRFAFAIQHEMAPSEREDFLFRAMQAGAVPQEWGNGTSIVLLRERGDDFVRRLTVEVARDPIHALESVVVESVAYNLLHRDLFRVDAAAIRELRAALQRASQDPRLTPEARGIAGRSAARLPDA
jgi:hypothetical protein